MLAYTACRHALVLTFDNHADALRFQDVLYAMGDLRGHRLLHLQPPREGLYDAGELADSDDLSVRQVADMDFAEYGSEVMLAVRLEVNVSQDDHLVIAVHFLKSAAEEVDRVLTVAAEPVFECPCHAARSRRETLTIGVVADPFDQRANCRFSLFSGWSIHVMGRCATGRPAYRSDGSLCWGFFQCNRALPEPAVYSRPFVPPRAVTVPDPSAPIWPDEPALFLDLDGTLLHFSEEPSGVHVSDRVLRLLGRLQSVTGGAVAVVSGRALDDVDRLLTPLIFPVAAVHGLVRRDSQGAVGRAEIDEQAFARLERALGEFVEEHPGTLLEHKRHTLALHYRRRPDLEHAVIETVESRIAECAPDLSMLHGNMVVEVKPSDQDKGSAIMAFMNEMPFRDRTPVFIGDDVTDEDGFRAVNELGGLSVKVADGDTVAQARLADIDAVLRWLEQAAQDAA